MENDAILKEDLNNLDTLKSCVHNSFYNVYIILSKNVCSLVEAEEARML